MLKLRTGLALTALGLSLGALAACTVTNQNHCALNQGACGDGMACSMCAIDNNGCVPLGAAIEDMCLFVGTSEATTDNATTTTVPTTGNTTEEPATSETSLDPTTTFTSDPLTSTSGSTTSEDSTETTEAPPCSGDVVDNVSCGGELPYCVDNNCVGCGDLSCPEVEPNKPSCREDLGRCVECVEDSDCSTAEKPACNDATATCEPCTSHDQCPDSACQIEIGECFPTNNILYVDNTTNPADPNTVMACSDQMPPPWGRKPSEPLCTLQNAVTRLNANEPTLIRIKVGSKLQSLPAEVPQGNFIVAIGHYGANVPSLVPISNDPAITVQEGNTVYMNRVQVYNTTPVSNPLIACDGGATGARLWLERQRILSGRTAVRANNCRVHVRRSTITSNNIGGVYVEGTDPNLAKLWVENSYITENNGTMFGAIRLAAAASAEILYSTIALNKSLIPTIDCTGGWSGTLKIRNSAIVNPEPHYGAGCGDVPLVTTNSLDILEGDKAKLGDYFSGFSEGVFQAKIGGKLKDVAVWQAGDPAVDFDGNPRPTEPGSLDYAGADRPGN